MRKTTTVIFSMLNGHRAIHFVNQPLAGVNQNVWFPIGNKEIFKAIEDIMVMNLEANNVVSVDHLRSHNTVSHDYQVTYNGTSTDWAYIDRLLEDNRVNTMRTSALQRKSVTD